MPWGEEGDCNESWRIIVLLQGVVVHPDKEFGWVDFDLDLPPSCPDG